MDRFLALVAFLFLAGFVGILVWYVPRLDLGIIVAVTLVMVAYDFMTTRYRGTRR